MNNKLINIERAFIIPEGLPGRPYYKYHIMCNNILYVLPHRHVLFAPSSINSYASSSFPGIVDSLYNATTTEDWNIVNRQLNIVAIHIRYATEIMAQPGLQWAI